MSYGYNKDDLTEFDKLNGKILNYQLEFESYEDNLGKNLAEFKKVNKKTHILWHESNNLSEEEKKILAKEIIDDYKKMYDSLPKNDKKRFTFDKNGKMSYEWDMSLLKKIGKDDD